MNADGERLRGKDLRIIPQTVGIFLHTVQNHDRLDLLALKYYGEPTRWWQISDANNFSFPADLLDRGPIHEETLGFFDEAADQRFNTLMQDVTSIATVRVPLEDFSLSSLVVLNVTAPLRVQVLGKIQIHGLHFLKSFAWIDGMNDGEIFHFEDRTAKENWQGLIASLANTPGIISLQPDAEEQTIHLVYNQVTVQRSSILGRIEARGYALDPDTSQVDERLGAQITIPPNQAS